MPAKSPVIVAVDQGTSATKAIVVDRSGRIVNRSSVRVSRADPRPGWVQQDALEIKDSVVAAIENALEGLDVAVQAVGLSNQRESALAWDRRTGEPLGPLLGWQDRRTAPRAQALKSSRWSSVVKQRTGLPIDPMFSALKLQWLLDEVDADRSSSGDGRIALGTVDSWLVSALTGEHRIEVGNASRTQLLDLASLDWDDELLELFDIPRRCLPRVASSQEPTGSIRGVPALGEDTTICGVLGDSHAALYAHGVRRAGQVKATYGSGNSIMGLIDPDVAVDHGSSADDGLVRTVAWAEERPVYAFEGTVLSTGATLVWLAQMFGTEPGELAKLAESVPDAGGVEIVPAFAGLGAPWWDESATAVMCGFGLGTGPAQVAHAAFESVALQTEAVLAAAENRLGTPTEMVLADGGPTRNDWLMQKQADLSQRRVARSNVAELSATGAGDMAGIACGFWTAQECAELPRDRTPFVPRMDAESARDRRLQWQHAVRRARYRPEQHPTD